MLAHHRRIFTIHQSFPSRSVSGLYARRKLQLLSPVCRMLVFAQANCYKRMIAKEELISHTNDLQHGNRVMPRVVSAAPDTTLNAAWNAYGDEGGHLTGADGTTSVQLRIRPLNGAAVTDNGDVTADDWQACGAIRSGVVNYS